MAVKSRPVVDVERQPGQATTARWRVPRVSVDEQTVPATRDPLIHSRSTCWGPGSIDPFRSAPTGLRTLLSVRTVMSNPLMTLEP